MTDDEIISALREADELLRRYRVVTAPVPSELAGRMSRLQGRSYTGSLGSYDSGIEVLSLEGSSEGWSRREDDSTRKTMAFLDEWREKLKAAGIHGVHVSSIF